MIVSWNITSITIKDNTISKDPIMTYEHFHLQFSRVSKVFHELDIYRHDYFGVIKVF